MNFEYKKKVVNPTPINPEDQRFMDLFNYYKREQKIFFIEKVHKDHDETNCPFFLLKLRKKKIYNLNTETKINNLMDSKNKNPIWIINKVSNEDSNLKYIPNQTLINSDCCYDNNKDLLSLKQSDLQKNNIDSLISSSLNVRKDSNSLKFFSFDDTPCKINSTSNSLNDKTKNCINSSLYGKNYVFRETNQSENFNVNYSLAKERDIRNITDENVISYKSDKNYGKYENLNFLSRKTNNNNWCSMFKSSKKKSKFENLLTANTQQTDNALYTYSKANSFNQDANNENQLMNLLGELQLIKNSNQKTISYLAQNNISMHKQNISQEIKHNIRHLETDAFKFSNLDYLSTQRKSSDFIKLSNHLY